MREKSPFTQTFKQLPNTLPIFPLNGAVVLPGGVLSLNIFEPRYLSMVQDAMKSNQLIGMIQVKDERSPPSLHAVGCAGRIVRYGETLDGRLEIVLEGLCRFRIHEELSTMRGYRLVSPNWQEYQDDFKEQGSVDSQSSSKFLQVLRQYFKENNIDVDWPAIEKLPQDSLVSNLVAQLNLTIEDKQLLIEAETFNNRIKSFTAILSTDSHDFSKPH